MKIQIQEQAFDVAAEIAALQQHSQNIGAIVSFVGIVREFSSQQQLAGQQLIGLELEHYPSMSQRVLHDLVEQAQQRWALGDVTIIHRVGQLQPHDAIVFVGVSSAHRQEAFSACEFLIDYLKTHAPFWKKENTTNASYWVAAQTHDVLATQRWQTK